MSESGKMNDETRKGVIRWFIREIFGSLFLGVILFWSAGRIDWIPGWVLVGITLAWTIATAVAVIPRNPGLLAERADSRKKSAKAGVKSWDTIILSIVGLLVLARSIVGGLDERYAWTSIPVIAQIIAAVVGVIGYAFVTWATAANAHFAMMVRIQDDRDHKVETGGPYKIVRHPGYLGTILFELSAPILLASWWALIAGAVIAVLFVVRTALEDKTLRAELDGYEDFTQQTRHRLIPGIW